jgi:hypothetical protein
MLRTDWKGGIQNWENSWEKAGCLAKAETHQVTDFGDEASSKDSRIDLQNLTNRRSFAK